MRAILSLLLLLPTACSTPSATANSICADLVEAGVASNCEPEVERGAGTTAVRFTLTGSGSHGFVTACADDEAYERTQETYRRSDAFMGQHDMRPHRYTHAGRRVDIMLVVSADAEAQRAAQTVIDQL